MKNFDKAEAQIEKIDLPENFFVNECTIRKGIMSFLCPKCEEKHSLQTKIFSSQDDEYKNNLIPTDKTIRYLRSTLAAKTNFVSLATLAIFDHTSVNHTFASVISIKTSAP